MAESDYTVIVTREEAKALGRKRYFTGVPCKNGHIAEYQTANYTCCECARLKATQRYQANLEKSRAHCREYYAENRERIRAVTQRSREKNRESVLAGKKAYYERIKKDPEWQRRQVEKRIAEKEKKQQYDKEYRARNPSKWTARALAWSHANPEKRRATVFAYDSRRRAQKKQGDSAAVIRKWVSAAKKICHWCGIKCDDEYHIDHYEPLSKGGEHRVSNLVIACPKCNLTKNAKDPYEFAATVGRLF